MINRRSIATALALAVTSLFGVTATARAQFDPPDPPVFTAGTEIGSRYNVNSSATYGPDSVAYESRHDPLRERNAELVAQQLERDIRVVEQRRLANTLGICGAHQLLEHCVGPRVDPGAQREAM
jgi:hypothetical protein